MNPHRQHADIAGLARNRFGEALAGIALAAGIGVSFAYLMVLSFTA